MSSDFRPSGRGPSGCCWLPTAAAWLGAQQETSEETNCRPGADVRFHLDVPVHHLPHARNIWNVIDCMVDRFQIVSKRVAVVEEETFVWRMGARLFL